MLVTNVTKKERRMTMINWDDIDLCEGCLDQFDIADINDDGLCEACAYEHDAKLDALTDNGVE